jgi:hypothetical protein
MEQARQEVAEPAGVAVEVVEPAAAVEAGGWEATVLEPALGGIVSAPVAVPDCRIKPGNPAST